MPLTRVKCPCGSEDVTYIRSDIYKCYTCNASFDNDTHKIVRLFRRRNEV